MDGSIPALIRREYFLRVFYDCLRVVRGDSSIAMKLPSNLGLRLLAVYLIIIGLIGIFGISLGQLSILVPILALVAGILILIGK